MKLVGETLISGLGSLTACGSMGLHEGHWKRAPPLLPRLPAQGRRNSAAQPMGSSINQRPRVAVGVGRSRRLFWVYLHSASTSGRALARPALGASDLVLLVSARPRVRSTREARPPMWIRSVNPTPREDGLTSSRRAQICLSR